VINIVECMDERCLGSIQMTIVVLFTDFRHFEGSNMFGLVAVLTERVFSSTRSADPVFDLGTLPSSLRVG